MGQLKLRAHVEVTLETSSRRFARIHNGVRAAAAFHVKASRPVTRLAADVLGIVTLGLQARVRGRGEIARNRFVTSRALARADELRAGNAGRRENGSATLKGAARKQNHGQRNCSPYRPKQSLALTVGPSS